MPGPQSAVGRNPTALFHLRARISPDGASACAIVVPRACMRIASALRRVLRFSRSRHSFADSAPSRTCCPGLPGWRARIASVTLSFRRPSGRENGRQFSYKQNAEEGVRLDEQRGTMVRGRKGGWRRPFVAGCGNGSARPSRAVLRPVRALRRHRGSLRSHPYPHSHEPPFFRRFTARIPGRIRPARRAFPPSLRMHRSLARSRISSPPSS